eukprot:1575078-Alexandrium_andersonii.AAC.1
MVNSRQVAARICMIPCRRPCLLHAPCFIDLRVRRDGAGCMAGATVTQGVLTDAACHMHANR